MFLAASSGVKKSAAVPLPCLVQFGRTDGNRQRFSLAQTIGNASMMPYWM